MLNTEPNVVKSLCPGLGVATQYLQKGQIPIQAPSIGALHVPRPNDITLNKTQFLFSKTHRLMCISDRGLEKQ